MSFNKSIQMLTVVWNEKRFLESKSARRAARRSVFRASTILLNTEFKILESQNEEIRHETNRCDSDLRKYDDKLQVLENMTHLATQSLEVYFQARMENLRTFVTEQCRIISDGIQEEADHWKEIHAMLQQKLVVPGDLRSYGGGNGLPRAVKQSPNFSRIIEAEEEEEEEEEVEETEEDKNNVTTILQSRTLTPLVTQSLKKARLLASKLSQEMSKLNMSATTNEQTTIEEPQPISIIPENHVTLGDVSAIEKAVEMDHEIPNPELSMSLLPCIPTVTPEEEEEEETEVNNKSIASTISDKTFVKTSLKPFSSDEESDEDDDDDDDEDEDTVIEESIIPDETESARPLLLTANRSIRIPTTRVLPNPPSVEKPKVKKEVSFREPLDTSIKTLLVNKNTFDAEKSDFVRPTIVENLDTSKLSTTLNSSKLSTTLNSSKLSAIPDTSESSTIPNTSKLPLPTIPSDEPNENEEETENKPIDEPEPIKSPVVEEELPAPPPPPPVENNPKRRTTRRTTTRLLRENQNDNLPPVEPPPKTRYATRYSTRFSTRLAASVIHEEPPMSRPSTVHRRTTRFTSE